MEINSGHNDRLLVIGGSVFIGQIAYRNGDITKARKLLELKLSIGLEQGLEETIKWVKKTNNG